MDRVVRERDWCRWPARRGARSGCGTSAAGRAPRSSARIVPTAIMSGRSVVREMRGVSTSRIRWRSRVRNSGSSRRSGGVMLRSCATSMTWTTSVPSMRAIPEHDVEIAERRGMRRRLARGQENNGERRSPKTPQDHRVGIELTAELLDPWTQPPEPMELSEPPERLRSLRNFLPLETGRRRRERTCVRR